jgi:hypothetical protein
VLGELVGGAVEEKDDVAGSGRGREVPRAGEGRTRIGVGGGHGGGLEGDIRRS